MAVPLLLALLASASPTEPEMWRGRLTYPGCTTNVPLDLKWDTTKHVAAANWTFQNCDGGHCGQGSAGGPVTIGGPGRAPNNWSECAPRSTFPPHLTPGAQRRRAAGGAPPPATAGRSTP